MRKAMGKLGLFFLLLICGLSFVIPKSEASIGYERIFYYRDTEAGKKSLYNNYKSIDILAPQTYAFGPTGALESVADPLVVAFAIGHGIKVMPLVVNKSFSQKGLSILRDPVAQNAAIIALTTEAKKMGYIGYQLDFEQMDSTYKRDFSLFVDKLHRGLKESGLILSVAVIAKVSDNPSDYKPGLYQKIIEVYDYKALAAASDFISIMSYDDPGSKGPPAREAWLQSVIDYSLKHIPKDKISLGIPLYYWKWNTVTNKLVGIGGYEGLQNAFARTDTVRGHSPTEKTAFLSYSEAGSNYMIWYEDRESLSHKLQYISNYGLRGFSAWVLGLEVPEIHDLL